MNLKVRPLALLGLLGITLGIVLNAPPPAAPDTTVVDAVAPRTEPVPMRAQSVKRTRHPVPAAAADPFFPAPKLAAAPAPPVAAPPPPPPPPQAPALPYRLLGRMAGPTGERTVYVTRGEQLFPIREGDVL